MFYFLIKIFLKINLINSFNNEIYSFTVRISNVALIIGIMAFIGEKYYRWLLHKNINFSAFNIEQYVGGKSEFLFMAAIIFIIAQLYKRGIEIQSENELTI